MDEPAAGLDPRARIELREMIRALAADGKAIIVSSHILTELAEMCDIVGIIEQGKCWPSERWMRFYKSDMGLIGEVGCVFVFSIMPKGMQIG